MPTGYTASIAEGSVTFKQFALTCAKAFGACIEMRDDPFDKPIPEKFEVSSHYQKALKETQARLVELLNLTDEEIEILCQENYEQAEKHRLESLSKIKLLRSKYEKMIDEVNKWEPPTSDHFKLKKFMLTQLTDSINFDCNECFYESPIERMTAQEYRANMIEICQQSVEFNKEQIVKEKERVGSRNNWIKALRDSLANYQ